MACPAAWTETAPGFQASAAASRSERANTASRSERCSIAHDTACFAGPAPRAASLPDPRSVSPGPAMSRSREARAFGTSASRSASTPRERRRRAASTTAAMIAVIEDGGYVRGMVDRLRELEARQDELNERLSAAPADLPDIHPNIADVYRRKVARLADALDHPEDRDAAAAAIRGLIERIVLTPSEKWAEMDAVLHGDLGAILEWAGNGRENTKTHI